MKKVTLIDVVVKETMNIKGSEDKLVFLKCGKEFLDRTEQFQPVPVMPIEQVTYELIHFFNGKEHEHYGFNYDEVLKNIPVLQIIIDNQHKKDMKTVNDLREYNLKIHRNLCEVSETLHKIKSNSLYKFLHWLKLL